MSGKSHLNLTESEYTTVNAKSIREQLKLRGYNFKRVANVVGVSQNYVGMVAAGHRKNHRVAIAIATALEKPVKVVFPDVPMYHGPVMTDEQREEVLALKLAEIDGVRRSA